jgi:hypothetical protein
LIQEGENDLHSTPASAAVFPKPGKGMLNYFSFEDRHINLNNGLCSTICLIQASEFSRISPGSYGATPKPVSILCEKWGSVIEARPDYFMRRTLEPMIVTAREKLARLVNCDVNECAIVPNASHGIATVLFNLHLKAGDIVVNCGFSLVIFDHNGSASSSSVSTTYGPVKQSLQYYADRIPGLTVSTIHLALPMTHHAIVVLFKQHLSTLPRHDGQRVVAIIDGIISQPGVIIPWEEMVAVCKEQCIFSLVDAAQCLGQVKVDLNAVQPDCWISVRIEQTSHYPFIDARHVELPQMAVKQA